MSPQSEPDFQPVGESGEVLSAVRGRLGHLVLNRPKAINALNSAMVHAVKDQLDAWAEDDRVSTVLVTGAGERGLCAGGDVRAIREAIDDPDSPAAGFLPDEYAMNRTIVDYPKPFVAWMDGIVMGGGLGVSAHGSHRLVTERSRIAMPETIIGFLPDVGMRWLLGQTPGEIGAHLTMTGASITGEDAVAIGFADLLVDSAKADALLELLTDGGLPAGSFGQSHPDSALLAQREWIDRCYAGDDAAAILDRLDAEGTSAGDEAAANIRARSPWAVTVALAALRRAQRARDVTAVLTEDAIIAPRMARHPDFAEGVRAQLVDKDFAPRWQHRQLADVPTDEVRAIFA